MTLPTDASHAARIAKDRTRLQPTPHLLDYEATCAAFDWDAAATALDGLPGGQGLNMAHEAVDRHLQHGRGGKTAIRWLGKAGERREFTLGGGRPGGAAHHRRSQPGRRPPRQRGHLGGQFLAAIADALQRPQDL